MSKRLNSVCVIGVIASVLATTGSVEAQFRSRERERDVRADVRIERDGGQGVNRTVTVSGDGPSIRLEQQGMRITLDIDGDRVFDQTVSKDWRGADIRHNGRRAGRLIFADGGGFAVFDTGDRVLGAPNAVWTGRGGNIGTATVSPGGQILYNDGVRTAGVAQPRTMIGITMTEVDGALAAALGLEDPGKATMIGRVTEGLAADRAGLKTYDVIVEIEGEPDGSRGALLEALREREPGDEIELTIIRAGKEREIEIELDAYDSQKLRVIEGIATDRSGQLPGLEARASEAYRDVLRLRGGVRADGDEWKFYTPYPPASPNAPDAPAAPGMNRFFLGDADDAFERLADIGVELDGLREVQKMIAQKLEEELSADEREALASELARVAERIGHGVREMVESRSALVSLERLGALGGGLKFQIETDGDESEIEEFVFPELADDLELEIEAFEIEIESLEEQLDEIEEELEERDERLNDRLDRIERMLERLLDQR